MCEPARVNFFPSLKKIAVIVIAGIIAEAKILWGARAIHRIPKKKGGFHGHSFSLTIM